jgi:hypothetical protein
MAVLRIEKQIKSLQALEHWFSTDMGAQIIQVFQSQIDSFQKKLNGNILLQLGSCAENPWLNAFRFQYKWILSPYLTETTTLAASLHQFPLDRNSVDCVLAPLTMDMFSITKSPLDEIDRILKPMGHVIFVGINPFSVWGAWLKLSSESCFGKLHKWPPSVLSIKYAMLRRGYIQCYLSNFYYIPPVKEKKIIQKLEILNVIGRMISPMPAGFYCLVMQKFQENYLTPTSSNLTAVPSS